MFVCVIYCLCFFFCVCASTSDVRAAKTEVNFRSSVFGCVILFLCELVYVCVIYCLCQWCTACHNCPSFLCGWSVSIFAAGMWSNQKCLSFHCSIIRCSTTDRVKDCLCWSYLVSSRPHKKQSWGVRFFSLSQAQQHQETDLQRRTLRFSRMTVFQLNGRSDFRWLPLKYWNWKLSMLSRTHACVIIARTVHVRNKKSKDWNDHEISLWCW